MKKKTNRKSIRKKAVILTVAALLGCLSAACGNESGESEKTLTVYMSEYQESYYREGIDEFRKAYPDVQLEIASYSMNEPLSSTEKVKAQMMAGEGPDLLLFSSLGIDDVYKYLSAGAFAPLDAYISAEKDWDSGQYVAEVMNGGRFDGTQYVMPLNYTVSMVLSSREALEEAGFDISAACKDMLSLMKQISALYETEYQEQILADCSLFIFFPQLLKGEFLNYSTGEVGTDPEELRAACRAYQNIYVEDNSANSLLEQGYYSQGTAILERRAYISALRGIDAFLQPMAAISAKETPVMIPISKGDGKSIAYIREYAGIRANSDNKENAWNLIRILLSEDMQKKMASATDTVPVLKAAIVSDIQQKLTEAVDGNSRVETGEISGELLEEYLNNIQEPGTALFPNDLSRKFIEYMQPYLQGEAEYEECLEEFKKYAKIYLTE